MNLVVVFPSPGSSESARKAVVIVAMTGTLTARDGPITIVTFRDIAEYPGYEGDDGAWKLLEKLKGDKPVRWYFLITNETQLIHGPRNVLFLGCLAGSAGADSFRVDPGWSPQTGPKRVRGEVANGHTATCRLRCPRGG